MERYLRVNLFGRDPRFIKEFTGPRSHKGWGTLLYNSRRRNIYLSSSIPDAKTCDSVAVQRYFFWTVL